MSAIDISLQQMGILYLLLLIPISIFALYRLKLVGKTVSAVLRMTVQLSLVGLYLKYLFEWNNFWLNCAWVLVMLVAANLNILKQAGLSIRSFLPGTLSATGIATILVVGVFLALVVRPEPVYDARYLVPITGMLLGNCLRANIVGLERFFSSVRENQKEFMTYLYLGASLQEACLPHLHKALRAALVPHISTMATLGIVSLPGMMTGQILGGGNPVVAIKYQLAIMVAILSTSALGVFLNLRVGMHVAFDEFHRLRTDILA